MRSSGRERLPKVRRLLPLLAALACCSAPPEPAAPRPAEAPDASYGPGSVEATPTEGLSGVELKVRVYADATYRAQLVDWESDFKRRLRRLNEVLEPTIGARLTAFELVPWERSQAGPLSQVLEEVSRLDPADDVDWVIALTEAAGADEKELAALGLAPPMTRYIVLRAGSATASGHERDVIFLHHLGASLGVPASDAEDALMNPVYSPKRRAYSQEAAQFLRRMLKVRKSESDPAALRAALDEALADEASPFPAEQREAVRDELRVAEKRAAEQLELSPNARPADQDAFAAAQRHAEAGRWVQAWEQLEPLLGFYPDDPAVIVLACLVDQGQGGSEAGKRCQAAKKVAGNRFDVAIAVASSSANAERSAEAAAALGELIKASGETLTSDEWMRIAEVYQQIVWVSAAEDAARRAGLAGRSLLDWASEMRARYTLPSGQKAVPREREAAYIRAIKEGLKVIYSGNQAAGKKAIKDLANEFPGTTAPDLLRCELALRQRQYDAAERHCLSVVRVDPRASWAHYLLGLLLNRKGKKEAARDKFQRAVDVDPSLEQAYEPLRKLLKELGDDAALKELNERHERRH